MESVDVLFSKKLPLIIKSSDRDKRWDLDLFRFTFVISLQSGKTKYTKSLFGSRRGILNSINTYNLD